MRTIYSRKPLQISPPLHKDGRSKNVSELYGELVFRYQESKVLTQEEKLRVAQVINGEKKLGRDLANRFAKALISWAIDRGVTHFCHWFQPLTGTTAEKHDAFFSLKGELPIEELSGKQLVQGEPDASSFPNGGFRNTYEARGYTSWDLTSSLFIREFENGKVLYIPTGYVSYYGEALDVKTPLLRSVTALCEKAKAFYNEAGEDISGVVVNCGVEQEYFLIDKELYFQRPDLVMTGRTLLGRLPVKNQQLEDHYFGSVPSRVLAFMSNLETELYRLGIPAKTRHNEVAPGQFELACIYKDVNETADNNHLVMAMLEEIADRHQLKCLLHEKPFAGMNGSGKHINWSISSKEGKNFLDPTQKAERESEENISFLVTLSIVLEAVSRHSKMLRASIASHSNDHRLGGNEAPPSIISVFLGETLTKVCESLETGEGLSETVLKALNLRAGQLAAILQDNTDRNRTSSFAFTGNKFEFRAVGSTASIGFPLTILNSAVADIFEESLSLLREYKKEEKTVQKALLRLARHWYKSSKKIIFNGDGYSDEWIKEAEKRGLSNIKAAPEAYAYFKDMSCTKFLKNLHIFGDQELIIYYNVFLDRYNTYRKIEFETLCELVQKYIIPYTLKYKKEVAQTIEVLKGLGEDVKIEKEILKNLHFHQVGLVANFHYLRGGMKAYKNLDDEKYSEKILSELLPYANLIGESSNALEEILPDEIWGLPTLYDMLFIH